MGFLSKLFKREDPYDEDKIIRLLKKQGFREIYPKAMFRKIVIVSNAWVIFLEIEKVSNGWKLKAHESLFKTDDLGIRSDEIVCSYLWQCWELVTNCSPKYSRWAEERYGWSRCVD